MTPKEKAEQLVDLYMKLKQVKLSDYSIIEHPTAKQCAKIVVNKILETNITSDEREYYEQVKKEIENL